MKSDKSNLRINKFNLCKCIICSNVIIKTEIIESVNFWIKIQGINWYILINFMLKLFFVCLLINHYINCYPATSCAKNVQFSMCKDDIWFNVTFWSLNQSKTLKIGMETEIKGTNQPRNQLQKKTVEWMKLS